MSERTALVTGGSRGIGAATCRSLAAAGYHVYVNYRSHPEEAAAVVEGIRADGGRAEAIQFDVASADSLKRALQEAPITRLDVLVNNAGILKDNLVAATPEQDWKNVIATNFLGMVHTLTAALPLLQGASGPTVVNMASISGFRGGKGQSSYATSKAMVIEWTRQLAWQHRESAMRFFAVSPGPVATEMVKRAPFYQDPHVRKMVPVNRFAEPEEIGQLVRFLVEQRGIVRSGYNWVADGGFTLAVKP